MSFLKVSDEQLNLDIGSQRGIVILIYARVLSLLSSVLGNVEVENFNFAAQLCDSAEKFLFNSEMAYSDYAFIESSILLLRDRLAAADYDLRHSQSSIRLKRVVLFADSFISLLSSGKFKRYNLLLNGRLLCFFRPPDLDKYFPCPVNRFGFLSIASYRVVKAPCSGQVVYV